MLLKPVNFSSASSNPFVRLQQLYFLCAAESVDGTPTSPEPIMSSFRPGPAKLYASPEEVKVVAIRQGSSTLGRTPKEGAKSRSHSLPPSGARPQVNIPCIFFLLRLHFCLIVISLYISYFNILYVSHWSKLFFMFINIKI